MDEFAKIYCDCGMRATVLMMRDEPVGIRDQILKIKKMEDWQRKMVPFLQNVIKERMIIYLDEMKAVVEDPMITHKEALLRANLNAEANLVGIDVIKRMGA